MAAHMFYQKTVRPELAGRLHQFYDLLRGKGLSPEEAERGAVWVLENVRQTGYGPGAAETFLRRAVSGSRPYTRDTRYIGVYPRLAECGPATTFREAVRRAAAKGNALTKELET